MVVVVVVVVVYLSIWFYLSICKLENEAMLWDCLSFWVRQHQKRSNSGRLPQFLKLGIEHQKRSNSARLPRCLKLATSKTKQFCETSFNNGKLGAEMTAWYQCVLRFFQSMFLKYCACHEKVMPGHTSAAPVTQNHFPKTEDLMLQNAPDLLISLTDMSLVLRLPPEMHLCTSSANVPHLPSLLTYWKCNKTLTFCSLLARCKIHCACHTKLHLNLQNWSEHVVFLTFWPGNVLCATTACTFSTCQLPKVLRPWCALHVLTWRCASRHKGDHFFDISRRTLFRQLAKVLRPWCALYILTWKCASRHNGVQMFDISTSKSGLRPSVFLHFWLHVLRATTACNFSSLIWPDGSAPAALASSLFDPTNHWKNTVFRHFANSSCTCIFFPLTLSLLWSSFCFSSLLWLFPPLLFHLSILSEVWLLNFLR